MEQEQDFKDKIEQFKTITSANDSIAKFYIESANGDLNAAIENYYSFVKPKSSSSKPSKPSGIVDMGSVRGEYKKDDKNEYYAGR